MRAAALAVIAAIALVACGGSGGGATGGGGHASSSSSGAASSSGGTCAADPLKTGLVAEQTGVSVDAFDCPILTWAAHYGEPDPMIFKAIIYVESRFDNAAVACPNMPCGTPPGWSADESGCYGLMQIVPACGSSPDNLGIGEGGHPDLVTDPSSTAWGNSIFNPEVNVHLGIAGIADNRAQVKQQFSGCTEEQYTLMAIGNYNSYGSTTSCTEYNTAYDDVVLQAYAQYAAAAGYAPHAY